MIIHTTDSQVISCIVIVPFATAQHASIGAIWSGRRQDDLPQRCALQMASYTNVDDAVL